MAFPYKRMEGEWRRHFAREQVGGCRDFICARSHTQLRPGGRQRQALPRGGPQVVHDVFLALLGLVSMAGGPLGLFEIKQRAPCSRPRR